MSRAASQAAQADARHQAEILEHWRDWTRYLEAQLTLLDAVQAEATSLPSFEREARSWEVQREQAEAVLKHIPAARRALFDQEREQRRRAVEHELEAAQQQSEAPPVPLDPHVIERDVLTRLLAEAYGRDGEWGTVPMGDHTWYQLAVPALLGAPDAAAYTVGDHDTTWSRTHLAMIGALCLALILGLWLTWPRRTPAAVSDSLPSPMMNGEAVQPWAVAQVVLETGHGAMTALPVTDIHDQDWPSQPADAAPAAYWRSAVLMPLELCVPAEVLMTARTARVQASGVLPERIYTLTATAPPRYHLHLAACSGSPQALIHYGTLTTVATPVSQELDRPVKLPDGQSLRVRAISVVGPGQDPTLPAHQYRILVRVDAPPDLDWSQFAPTLVLLTGQSVLLGETKAIENGVELHYLVPSFETPMELVWTLTLPDAVQAARWRHTLEPPPTRLAILRQALDAEIIEAIPVASDAAQVVIRVKNTGPLPLQLTPDDLSLLQGTTSIALPALATLQAPLATGEERVLELVLQRLQFDQPLLLTLGAHRFSISLQQ